MDRKIHMKYSKYYFNYTVKKKGILPNFYGLALFYETILSSVAQKSFRNFHTELF
jgi:hypothetical protein